MYEEYKKYLNEYLIEYVDYNKYINIKDLNSKYYDNDYKVNIIDYTKKLKEKEDSKVKNEKILESMPIAEIERFLRKKKLEKLKSKEE